MDVAGGLALRHRTRHHPVVHDLVCRKLLAIIERLELSFTIPALKCSTQEIIGDIRILGQERSVHIGTDHILVETALLDLLLGVAVMQDGLWVGKDDKPLRTA